MKCYVRLKFWTVSVLVHWTWRIKPSMKYRHFNVEYRGFRYRGYHYRGYLYRGYRSSRIELKPGLVWWAQVKRSQLVITTNRASADVRPWSVIDQLASCRLLAATNRSTQQLTGEPLGGRSFTPCCSPATAQRPVSLSCAAATISRTASRWVDGHHPSPLRRPVATKTDTGTVRVFQATKTRRPSRCLTA